LFYYLKLLLNMFYLYLIVLPHQNMNNMNSSIQQFQNLKSNILSKEKGTSKTTPFMVSTDVRVVQGARLKIW